MIGVLKCYYASGAEAASFQGHLPLAVDTVQSIAVVWTLSVMLGPFAPERLAAYSECLPVKNSIIHMAQGELNFHGVKLLKKRVSYFYNCEPLV